MRKKLLMGITIFALCLGMAGGPILSAEDEQEEIRIRGYEIEETEGENYGHISIGYTVPVTENDEAILDNYNTGLHGSGTLPASYDARDYGHVSAVKDQGYYGTCWAFAAISSAESDAIIDGRNLNPDYSEAQLAFFTYNRVADPLGGTTGDKVEVIADGEDYLSIGGNNYYTTMALASWISPADETTMDYDDIATKYTGITSVDESYDYEACVAHLQNAYWISMSDPDSIKQMIMEYGSLDSSLYYSDDYLEEVTIGNTDEWLFYNPEEYIQNHEISLVGWDDTIDAELFTKTIDNVEYTPVGDGAWLVKNSYGDYYHNDGYFWVSYYDTSLMYANSSYNVATAFDFEAVDNYDYNYQYDGSYATFEVYGEDYNESVYTANVFTAQKSVQQLEAVSFYTTLPNMKYSIQVYKVDGNGTPIGEALLTEAVEGLEPYSGYHTVKLNERIILNKGDKFSVVVKNTITTDGYVGIGATAFLDASNEDGYLRYTSSGQIGQSYLSFDGVYWEDMYDRYGANLRVKAFTNYRPVESVVIEEEQYVLGIGGEKTLIATLSPENATILDIAWSSDDEDVATVDSTGKVTAIGAGTATITATSKDGGKTDSCTVRVKERFATPDAPVMQSRTETEITLSPMEGCLYSMDKDNWQESNVFTGLKAGTSYTFYVKTIESEEYSESLPSLGTSIRTYYQVAGVTVSPIKLSLEIGGTEEPQLTATVSPSDVMDKTVTWSSDNNTIATVSEDGKVNAVGPGQAIITATTNSGGKKATCTVDVYKKYDAPEAPELSSKTADSVTLVKQDGYEYSMDKENWSSSNVFTGLEEKTTYTFYARRVASGYYLDSEASEGLQVTTYTAVTDIVLDYTELELAVEGIDDKSSDKHLIASVFPSNVENASIIWSSKDENIAIADETGKVTAVGAGKVEIVAKSAVSDVSSSCMVEVYEKYATPASPELSAKTATSITLKRVESGYYSMDGENWQESNVFTNLTPKTTYTFYVKKVDNGYYVESDVSEGTQITTYSKVSGVTVTPANVSLEMGVSETAGLTATVSPSDVADNTVRWSSSNASIAKVDNNGRVTALAAGTVTITATTNEGNYKDSCTIQIAEKKFVAPDIKVSYRTHIQSFGWEYDEDEVTKWKYNGAMSGTSGLAKRLEGINIVVAPTTTCEDLDLGIQYTTHCQSYGWLPWSADGDMNGTEGEAKRLEAIMIQLTGEHADYYDVYYRVHAQTYGWLGWASNGEPAGTAGYAKRLEGIQIVVVKKDASFNQKMGGITSGRTDAFVAKAGSSPIVNYPATSNTKPVVPGEDDVNVTYRTHVQSFGWQGWKYNGQMSGTSGLAKRLEGIEINVTNKNYDGGVAYCTHVQKYGWQGADLDKPSTWKHDGEMAGTSGEAKRLEAICITLTGGMAEHYDIYYRVHAQSYGWLGWAKNGAPAGTAGYAKRLEGIQIVVVPKGNATPANSYMGVTSVKTQAYVEK